MTIHEFIAQHNIIIDLQKVAQNPNMTNDTWSKQATHWEVIFRYGKEHKTRNTIGRQEKYIEYVNDKKFVTYFSTGSGHKGKKPTCADVLDCLVSDASSVESYSLDEWLEELGYVTEGLKAIREAEKTYSIIQTQTQKLIEFLGKENYKTLAYEVERL